MLIAQTKAAERAVIIESERESFSWANIIGPVEPFLSSVGARLGEQVRNFEPGIAVCAEYALSQQGKQLRPALVALSGRASGKLNDDLVTVAVIIEMVHLATLVHDDIMDLAQIRRRRPTLAANWGNEVSVLLGDCLFAQAVCLASGFPTPEVCRAVAAATHKVCSGEILQTQQRGNLQLSLAEYTKMVAMKTAELFALSCDLGAGLAGATPVRREALRNYGMAMGTAYQIYDDCLDLFGTEQMAGKSLGTDLANGKYTLPILLTFEEATPDEVMRLKALLTPWDRQSLPELLELVEKYSALANSRRIIQTYLTTARQCLSPLAESESRRALHGLVDFLAQQTGRLGVSY